MIIQKDFPLSQILWYGIGGKAKYLLTCENYQDILEALEFVDQNKIDKSLIYGLGSNLILPDVYFNGAVIHIAQSKVNLTQFKIKDNSISVFGGAILDDLIQFAFANSLIGLEWAGGLPGTIGAGVRGNVGAFGGEIKDSLYSAEVLETKHLSLRDHELANGEAIPKNFKLRTLSKNDLNFSYRNSLVKKNSNMIIVSTTFHLRHATGHDLAKARDIYTGNINYRVKHHPMEYPSCGSVFKNITESEKIKKILAVWPDIEDLVTNKWHGKVAMGYVIKRLAFAGLRVGNMQVSEKHSNFIVNLGDGRSSDVLTLIKQIQNEVSETFKFVPETEAEIVSL